MTVETAVIVVLALVTFGAGFVAGQVVGFVRLRARLAKLDRDIADAHRTLRALAGSGGIGSPLTAKGDLLDAQPYPPRTRPVITRKVVR